MNDIESRVTALEIKVAELGSRLSAAEADNERQNKAINILVGMFKDLIGAK